MNVDPPAKKPVETTDTTLRPVSRDAKEKKSFTLSDILNSLPLPLALEKEKSDTIDEDEAAAGLRRDLLFWGLAILTYIGRGQSPYQFSAENHENASYSKRGRISK